MSSTAAPTIVGVARSPVPHKDFSDLYEKLSGKAASASEAHSSHLPSPARKGSAGSRLSRAIHWLA